MSHSVIGWLNCMAYTDPNQLLNVSENHYDQLTSSFKKLECKNYDCCFNNYFKELFID